MSAPVVVAGGGLAAQRFVETLRRLGHEGRVLMVCAEPRPPYDRPPLSKELLAGTRNGASLRFRDDVWYRDHDVELRLGVPASGLDAPARTLELGDGTRLHYASLLVATGAAAFTPPALRGHRDVLTLRDVGDAQELSQRLRPGHRLAIVGAGFIGLEVAATAASLGAEVTVVEAAPAPLAGPLGEEIGGWFGRLHRRHGIAVHTSTTVTRASANTLELSCGQTLAADSVLAAAGVRPNTAWMNGAQGVPTAGDAAGGHHWEAAARDGADAARAVLGLPPAPAAPVGFWSDQHGVRFQLVGDPARAGQTTIDGELDRCDFTVTYWRGDRPAAILLAGRPAELPAARRSIAEGRPCGTDTERSAA